MDVYNHLKNRQWMVASLAGEIFGPGGRFEDWKNDLYGEAIEIDIKAGHVFDSWEDYRKRYVHIGDREEILKEEGPLRQYGVGILFPHDGKEADAAAPTEDQVADESALGRLSEESDDDSTVAERKLREKTALQAARLMSLQTKEEDLTPHEETEESALSLSRLNKPRSMGVSFAADLSGEGKLEIFVQGGRYRRVKEIRIKDKEGIVSEKQKGRNWWVRIPVSARLTIPFSELVAPGSYTRPVTLEPLEIEQLPRLDLSVYIVSRVFAGEDENQGSDGRRLLTVTLVNSTRSGAEAADQLALFQSRFIVTPMRSDKIAAVLSYPGLSGRKLDHEEQSLELLYRRNGVFATGHGCAGDWDNSEGADRTFRVIAEPLPFHETPPVTPDLIHPRTNEPLQIRMLPLAQGGSDSLRPLKELADLYEAWIADKAAEAGLIEERYRPAAERHVKQCRLCAKRIRGRPGFVGRGRGCTPRLRVDQPRGFNPAGGRQHGQTSAGLGFFFSARGLGQRILRTGLAGKRCRSSKMAPVSNRISTHEPPWSLGRSIRRPQNCRSNLVPYGWWKDGGLPCGKRVCDLRPETTGLRR